MRLVALYQTESRLNYVENFMGDPKHVLIIEDEAVIALELEALLEDLGYRSFEVADTPALALDAARRRRPDLITADYRIIDGTGLEAVDRISAELGPIRVVFVSGNAALLKGRSNSPVLDKPITSQALRAACLRAHADAPYHRTS